MVNLNLNISLPVRVTCVQDKAELQLKWTAPGKPECVLKCPVCGVEIRMVQGEQPQPLPSSLDRIPKFQVQPKT